MTPKLQSFVRGRSARRLSPLASWLLLTGVIAFLIVLFLIPVVEVLAQSFLDPEFGFSNYRLLVEEPLYIRVLQRTFQISLAVAALCVVLGYPVAYLMARSSGITAAIVGGCILIPLWTSVLVRSYSWITLLQRNGLLNQWLESLGLIDRP